jgi:hypothetical protein
MTCKLRTFALAGILIGLAPTSGDAYSIEGSRFSVGAWTVEAFTNDTTGVFSHCVASVPYRHGVSLAFSIDSDAKAWRMGLINPAWKLPIGEKYPVSYTIDNRVPATDLAVVATPELIMVELAATNQLFDLFRTGHTLVIGAAGGNFNFDLKDSSRALKMALDCTAYYENQPTQAAIDPQNPFAAKATTFPAETRAEAATVLANVLGAAGVQGFRLISDMPPELKEYHAAWAALGVIGGLRIQAGATVHELATALVALDERECNGTYASIRERAEQGLIGLRTACKEASGNTVSIAYTLVPRLSGGVYQFFVIEMPASDAQDAPRANTVEVVGGRLFDASLQAINRE